MPHVVVGEPRDSYFLTCSRQRLIAAPDSQDRSDLNSGDLETFQIQKAEEIKYLETTRSMSKYGKIRAVVIQSGANQQRWAIYTNATEEQIGAERIVQLICRRWGEENAIKVIGCATGQTAIRDRLC